MHKRTVLLIFLACFCSASAAGLKLWLNNSNADAPYPGDIALPLLMPMSIISSPQNRSYEISYIKQADTMLVKGKINSVPVWFVVDTGASFVTISPEIARKAGIDLKGSPHIQLQTANGAISAPMVALDSVVADDIEMRNVQAVIHSPTPDPNIGLLGMSFFGQHQITINHASHTIVLESK